MPLAKGAPVPVSSRPMFQRLLALDERIRSGSYPSQTALAEELEVSRRTLLRDCKFLKEQCKAPLRYDAARRGFHYTDPSYRLSLLKVSEKELVAIFLAERLLKQYGDTPFASTLAGVFGRCVSLLTDEVVVDAEALRAVFAIRPTPQPLGETEIFETLAGAVRRQHSLDLHYWTAERDEATNRRVDPYGLASVQGDWYLVGWCHLRRDVRTFAVHRIRAVEATRNPFDRPTDFHLDGYLGSGFGRIPGKGKPRTVRLRFGPLAARYVREKEWHPEQKIVDLPDGSLRWSAPLRDLREVKAWALSWGSECVAEFPGDLVAEIRADLAGMAAAYRAGQQTGVGGLQDRAEKEDIGA